VSQLLIAAAMDGYHNVPRPDFGFGLPEKTNSKTSSLIQSAPTCSYPERIPFLIG
jgi:hypothetical protein